MAAGVRITTVGTTKKESSEMIWLLAGVYAVVGLVFQGILLRNTKPLVRRKLPIGIIVVSTIIWPVTLLILFDESRVTEKPINWSWMQ